jgi:hypothetical protein
MIRPITNLFLQGPDDRRPECARDGRWQPADLGSLDLDRVNSDEGKLMIASSALSISHPKK